MKLKKSGLLFCALFTFALGNTFTLNSTKVSAATTAVPIDVALSPGCVSYVVGANGPSYSDITPGSNVSLEITNQDDVVSQSITGNGIASNTQVWYNSRNTINETTVVLSSLTSPVTVTFTPIPSTNNGQINPNYCPTGSTPKPSSILINPASATLLCVLSGSNWYLNGSFNGSSTGTGIYNGSTLVTSINPGSISQKVSASSTAQAFTIIDGANYSGKGTALASTSCPKYDPGTTTPDSTPSTTTTTPTTSTSTPSTSATLTPTTDPSVTKSSPVNTTELTPIMSPSSSNASLLLKSGLGLLGAILIVVILDIAGIWNAPKLIFVKIWQKVGKLFNKTKNTPQEPTDPLA